MYPTVFLLDPNSMGDRAMDEEYVDLNPKDVADGWGDSSA